MEGLADGFNVMAVHNNGMPSERLHPGTVDVDVVLEGGGLALSESVHVDDSNEVVKTVVASKGGSLPDTTLGTLPITHHTVDTVAGGGIKRDHMTVM